MLFMGQEFLEDKYWSDSPDSVTRASSGGTASKRTERWTTTCGSRGSSLAAPRHPALRGDPINVFHVHNDNRVLAFHRWIEGAGHDVVVVVSLNDQTWWAYGLGFPRGGRWPRSSTATCTTTGYTRRGRQRRWRLGTRAGLHGLPTSASVVIPANSIVVFAKDHGN